MKVVLTGNNTHLLQEELRHIVQDFSKEHGDSIERFDCSELTSISDLVDAVRSISFLEPRKLVIARDFGQNKELLENFESIIEQTADSTDLILVDQKLDKRTSTYKIIQKITDVRVFGEMSPIDLQKWLINEADKYEAKLGPGEARALIERAGPSQLLLQSEVEKLALSSTNITKHEIKELIEPTPQSKIFSMLDALFQGEPRRSWDLYKDQRAQGEEPQKILAMITWQLQQLTKAVFVPDNSKQTLIDDGMSPYSAQKSLAMGRLISKRDLKHYIKELAVLDAQTKTNADIESALAVYFTDVAVRQSTS